MYISKDQALHILREHGIRDGNEPTGLVDNGTGAVEMSSFFDTFGDRLQYRLEDVMQWLGY